VQCSVKLSRKLLEVLNQEQKKGSQSRKFPSTRGESAQGLERTHPGQAQARDMRPSSFSHIYVFYFFNPCSMIQVER